MRNVIKVKPRTNEFSSSSVAQGKLSPQDNGLIYPRDELSVSDGEFVSSINSLLRRIKKQNSSEADSSVGTSSRRANGRIIRLRRIIRL